MTSTSALLALPQGTPPELVKAINDNVRETFGRHGLAAFTMPRNAALAHEAGHAVVAAHEGMTIRQVTVFSRSMAGVEAWGGECTEAGGWTTAWETTAADDLARARFIVRAVVRTRFKRRSLGFRCPRFFY